MIGDGVLDRIWRGPGSTLSFLWLGSARSVRGGVSGAVKPLREKVMD
jgi:hypothetical protein